MLDRPPLDDILAALVASNGDLFLQVHFRGQIVFGNSTFGTIGSTDEYANYLVLARYSSSGVLQWARDMMLLLGNSVTAIGTVALASSDDLAVVFNRYDPPPPPPGALTSQDLLGRIDGGNPAIKWEGSYGPGVQRPRPYDVIPRPARNDFITMGTGPDMFHGCCDQIIQMKETGTATVLGPMYSYGAMTGRDGATLWMYGAWSGSALRFNPWSQMTWNVPANPFQFGTYDTFIIGAKDDGTSFGPWITQGDEGPALLGFALATDGQPIFTMAGTAPVRINGQELLAGEGQVVAKLDATTGTVVWKTDIADRPGGIAITGDQGIATVALRSDSPPRLTLYDATNGHPRSSFIVPGSIYKIVAGPTDLFLVGTTTGAADFNPGAATDTQGAATPGIFITRYSF
jgi:hypothetical protein